MLSWKNVTQSPEEHPLQNHSAFVYKAHRDERWSPHGNRCRDLPMREAQEGGQEEMQEGERSGGEHDQGERNKTAKTSTEETEREREGRRENRGVRNSRNRKQNRRAATGTEGVIKLEKRKSTGRMEQRVRARDQDKERKREKQGDRGGHVNQDPN